MRKFSKFIVLFLSLSFALLLVACGEKLQFGTDSITIEVGQEETLEPIVVGEDLVLTWKSSDTSIVTVTDNGTIKGIKAGEAKVTVSVEKPELSAEITVKVEEPATITEKVTSVMISGHSATAKVGDTMQLSASVIPAAASQSVTWESSDEEVAEVDATGKVTFKKLGVVLITAKSVQDPTKSKFVSIVVGKPDVTGIEVKAMFDKEEVGIGETLQLLAVIEPLFADEGVDWTVNDSTIAEVDEEGVLTGKQLGEVVITATSKLFTEVKGTLTIEVVLPDPATVTINADHTIIQVEEEMVLNASVMPSPAAQTVTFVSNNEEIATVDAEGKVTGVAAGNVVIEAISTVDDNIVGTYSIKVIEKLGEVNYANILVVPEYTKDRYSRFSFGGVTYITDVTALDSASEAFEKAVEGSVITFQAGTYLANLNINVNNVKVYGPNKDVAQTAARAAEAEIQGKIILGDVEGIEINGIKLGGPGQIKSTSSLKDIKIKSVNAQNVSVDPAQGVIFFGLSNAEDVNENVLVSNCTFNDANLTGYRGVRINNAKNLTVSNCYFYGFYDAIQLEGINNTADAGSGAAGTLIIEDNKFESNIQYPIRVTRYSATSIEVNDNIIGVNPDGEGTFGTVNFMKFVPGEEKTIVNINGNTFPFSTVYYEVRFKTEAATKDQIEINAHYNIFEEAPWVDEDDPETTDKNEFLQYTHFINHSYNPEGENQVVINAEYNVFTYDGGPKPEYFANGVIYEPYFTTHDQIFDYEETKYVDDDWAGKVAGEEVEYNGWTLIYGQKVFATIAEAVAVAEPGMHIMVLPGTYTGDVVINKTLTFKTKNAALNPVEDDTQFKAGTVENPTDAVIYNGVFGIDNGTVAVNNVVIKGFSFTGAARVKNVGTKANNGFVFENNYVFDTNESSIAWTETAFSGAGSLAITTVPGFLMLASAEWLGGFKVMNNKFVNVKDINVYMYCVNGATITGNSFFGGTRDAIRMDYAGVGGVVDIKNNTFENIDYSGIYFAKYAGATWGSDLTANIENNHFKNVGIKAAEATVTKIQVGAIAMGDYVKVKNAAFNIKFNVFEECANYISLRSFVTDSAAFKTGTLKWTATINYNAFIDADPVANYLKTLFGTDTADTNLDLVKVNNNFYGTTAEAKADITPEQFDLFDAANSNTVVYETKAALDEAIDALTPAA